MTGSYRVPGTAVLAALMLAVWGGVAAAQQAKSPEKPPMSVDGIRDTTEAFVGKRVRFTGTVDRVLGSRVLIFKDQDPTGKEHLLAITRRPIRQVLGEGGAELKGGDEVLVTGVVDFRNRRPDFTDNFLNRLANYEFAAANLKG